jgi:hypothetical protein
VRPAVSTLSLGCCSVVAVSFCCFSTVADLPQCRPAVSTLSLGCCSVVFAVSFCCCSTVADLPQCRLAASALLTCWFNTVARLLQCQIAISALSLTCRSTVADLPQCIDWLLGCYGHVYIGRCTMVAAHPRPMVATSVVPATMPRERAGLERFSAPLSQSWTKSMDACMPFRLVTHSGSLPRLRNSLQ